MNHRTQTNHTNKSTASPSRLSWEDVVDPVAFRQALVQLVEREKHERPSRGQRIKNDLTTASVVAVLLGMQIYFSHEASGQWLSREVVDAWTGIAACIGVIGLAVAGTVIGLTRTKVEHRVLWLGGTLLAGTFARNLPPDEDLALLVPLAMVAVTFAAHLLVEHSSKEPAGDTCNHSRESV